MKLFLCYLLYVILPFRRIQPKSYNQIFFKSIKIYRMLGKVIIQRYFEPFNKNIFDCISLAFNYTIRLAYVIQILWWLYVCVFILCHYKGFSWLKKEINVMPEVQASDGILVKYFCVKYLCRQVIDNNRRNLQSGYCAKECRLNRASPPEVK